MMTPDSPASSSADSNNPYVNVTLNAINWDALLEVACKVLHVQKASWGKQKSGGYNLVRFLQLGNDEGITVVVRVPIHPEEGATRELMKTFCDRIRSEVATMQYIEAHTSISVPHVIHYDVEVDDNGVRSPYIIMTKMDGIPLCNVWDSMPDDKRDKVLRQVVDFYLELSLHRFDKIGALSTRQVEGKDTWHILPLSLARHPEVSQSVNDVYNTVYSSGTDYWIAYANAKLKTISEQNFGYESKSFSYQNTWFLRSIIPSLYDSSLDASGFPIDPGDFHSQNIFILGSDSEPRITAIVDWEFTTTACTSSFAQYPFFIVDHPHWPDDDPLRLRNVRDQAAFDRFMLEAERKKDPSSKQLLSRAFANCKGIYLFEQCMTDPDFFGRLYPQFFSLVFGDDLEEENFSEDYCWVLLEKGILRELKEQFDQETEVWRDAESILGDEVADQNFTRSDFVKFATQRKGCFPEGGTVRRWLESVEQSERHLD